MRQTPARFDVLPSCPPFLQPVLTVHRTVRRIIRHKLTAAHPPAPSGLRAHAPAHNAAAPKVASATPTKAKTASDACVRAPADPGGQGAAAKSASAQPTFGKAFDPAALKAAAGPMIAPQGAATVWGGLTGSQGAALGGLATAPTAALIAATLLATAGGAAIGGGAHYLEQTGAFNTLIAAPAPTAAPTLAFASADATTASIPITATGNRPASIVASDQPATSPTPATAQGSEPSIVGPTLTADATNPNPSAPSGPAPLTPSPAPSTLPQTSDKAPVAVPEPATLLTFGLGGLAAILARLRTRRAPSHRRR